MNAVTLQCKSIRIVLLLDDYGSSMSVLFVLRRTCSGGRTASTGSCTRLWGLSIGGVLKGKADESSRIAMNNLSWREFLFTVEMGSKSSSLRFLRLPVGVLLFLSIINNFTAFNYCLDFLHCHLRCRDFSALLSNSNFQGVSQWRVMSSDKALC